MSGDKLYELRYYRVAAQDIAKFRALTCEKISVRVRASRLIGYWVTDLGAVNHVLHIWEYDSLTHRKAVRDEMLANEEWIAFLKHATPSLQTMDNWLSKPLLGNFASDWSDKEFYKLTTVRYLLTDSQATARERFLATVGDGNRVKAAWETVIGNGREFSLMESADNADDLIANHFDNEANVSVQTKILYTYPWSQWSQ